MKLPKLWRRSPATSPEPASSDVPVDITIPRECIYQSFEGHPGPCPRCGGPLQQSRQTYMVATKRGRKLAEQIVQVFAVRLELSRQIIRDSDRYSRHSVPFPPMITQG